MIRLKLVSQYKKTDLVDLAAKLGVVLPEDDKNHIPSKQEIYDDYLEPFFDDDLKLANLVLSDVNELVALGLVVLDSALLADSQAGSLENEGKTVTRSSTAEKDLDMVLVQVSRDCTMTINRDRKSVV